MTEMIGGGVKIQFFGKEDRTDQCIKINDVFYIYHNRMEIHPKRKEENTMKVSYKGVTGELVKLERGNGTITMGLTSTAVCKPTPGEYLYNLEIWENDKGWKVSFPGVSLKDVKFLGGEVTYG